MRRRYLVLFLVGFLLNFLWEVLQMPLFVESVPYLDHVGLCAFASVGDALMVLALYALIAGVRRDRHWIRDRRWPEVLTTVLLGALFAWAVEEWSLTTGYHAYRPGMPRFPGSSVSLLPLVQMGSLPMLSFLASDRLLRLLGRSGPTPAPPAASGRSR